MWGKRSSQLQAHLSVDADSSELEPLAGVPIFEDEGLLRLSHVSRFLSTPKGLGIVPARPAA